MNNDIMSILDDYVPESDPIRESECLRYVSMILKQVYKPKEIYDHYIRQHIYYKYPNTVNDGLKLPIHSFQFNDSFSLKNKVTELQKIPLPVQRSPEWFEARRTRITASELATVFGENSFASKEDLILDKCGHRQNMSQFVLDICQHGVIFEDIAVELYESRTNSRVIEFGCLPHPKYDYIAASPDGITTDGIMLEIKCPTKREIIGIPRIYYWYQMQMQLEVADLNRCDFLECHIELYSSISNFMDDTNDNLFKTKNNYEKGVIIEYTFNDKKMYKYYKPDNNPYLTIQKQDLAKWQDDTIDILINDNKKDYIRTIYWKLSKYSCVAVYRDRQWFSENNPIIKSFWDNEVVPVLNDNDAINKLLKSRENKKKTSYRGTSPGICLLD